MNRAIAALLPSALLLFACEQKPFGEFEFAEGVVQHAVHAANIDWKPCPPNLPPGCELAVLEGNPQAEGLFTVRFRVSEELIMPPHTHPRDERVTLLAGRASVAFGADATRDDAVHFGPGDYYLTIGRFVDEAPYTSDYTFENIYYRSIRRRQEDYLSTADYIWRWDTDWFWCSKNLYAQNPVVRRLYGRSRLNSLTYTRIMRWNSRWKLTRGMDRLLGYRSESVIQDVDIPLENCADFLSFYLDNIRFTPVWICPIRAWDQQARFPLYPMDNSKTYVNFGFWDVIRNRNRQLPKGHYNRLIEARVRELGGIKSLYSDAYFTPEEFWSIYSRDAYGRLKARYDPEGRLKDLYAKCVLRE